MSDNLQELIALAQNGDTEAKKAILATLGLTLQGDKAVREPKPGEMFIGKVRTYISDKGGVHFQGAPGTSQKWGLTLYKSTIEFIIDNQDAIIDFLHTNEASITTKAKK